MKYRYQEWTALSMQQCGGQAGAVKKKPMRRGDVPCIRHDAQIISAGIGRPLGSAAIQMVEVPQEGPSLTRWPSRVLSVIGLAELGVGVLLIFFISICIVVGVFFRYVLGSSLVFVEESVTIAFIWVTFLGASVAVKMRRHIVITTIAGLFGNRFRAYLDLFCNIFVLAVAVVVAIFATQYIEPQNRSLTVSLPFNFPRGWVFSIPTLYAMVSIALTQIAYVVDSAVRILRPAPPRQPLTILGG
ncbi:MAG: TRAP transporter small permease subunit [Azospirillaceae bacterium]